MHDIPSAEHTMPPVLCVAMACSQHTCGDQAKRDMLPGRGALQKQPWQLEEVTAE